MELKTVQTQTPKAKVSLQGAAGSGKTYSALLLAYALTGDWNSIALIETSKGASCHYSYLGAFNVLSLSAPFHSLHFVGAIELCERAGMEVIILDSLSQEWVGTCGVLDMLKEDDDEQVMDRHESLMQAIEGCKTHIICTLHTEEYYSLCSHNPQRQVEKHGLKPLQEEGIHQRFHTCLYLDMQHRAYCLKDRTSFFEEHSGAILTEEITSLFALRCREENNTLSLFKP